MQRAMRAEGLQSILAAIAMRDMRIAFVLLLLAVLSACSHAPPRNPMAQ